MFILLDFRVPRNYPYTSGQGGDIGWEGTFLIAIPFIIVIAVLLFTWFRNDGEFWKGTGFPSNFKFTDKNYTKILVAFGCVIAYREEEYSIREKLSWIRNYLNKDQEEVVNSYELIASEGIKIQKLVVWANKHLDKSKKIHLLEFVIQLAHSDNSINSREAELIFYLLRKLNVDIDALNETVKELLIEKKQPKVFAQKVSKIHYLNVLGLNQDATLTQMKSAYRKLVKIHHPDNHRHASEAEKNKHVAIFLEVQRAYEILTSEMNGQ